nr:hypothetical protein HAGR004_03260 [Bdellovibrio sp. HAGR004]
MKANFLFLTFLASLFCHFASAAEQSSRPELIEVKSRLEDSIAKRYRERIATRIPTELFNVAVQATIKIKEDNSDLKSPTKEPSNPKTDLPDINLGIIESIAVGDSTLTESPDFAKISKSFLERVEIKKIEIIVGLSPKLGEEYKATFKPWLSSTVKGDFGNIGSIKVADLAPMPKEETTESASPERPRVLTFEEKFGNYQNAIGLGVFSLILLIALLLFKFLPSRDMKEQVNLSLRIQEMKDSQLRLQNTTGKGAIEAKKSEKQEIQLNANLLFDSFREHQKKVALIALSSPGIADQVLDRWFEEGTEGRKKVASLVDCVLTHYGNNSSNIPLSGASWNLPERIKSDKELPSIFTAFSGYSLQEKTALVEKTYWDLLSVKTLGDKLTSLPFASMAQLPASKIQKVLSKQDKKVQSLTILHLPQEKMEEVISGLSFEEKKNMIVEAFAIPKMKPQEIEMADQSLKFLIKKEESVDDGLVEIQSMIPNMLMCLSPLEEIQLIQQILPTLSDQGHFIKRSYPSLAFLSQWPEEKLKHFLTGVQPNDILALVKAIPEATEVINSVIPNRTQTILKDSLNRTLTSEELNNGLGTLRIKLFKYANDGIINLELIFKDAPAAPTKAA